MKRGVLEVNKNEIVDYTSLIDINKFSQSALFTKLQVVLQSNEASTNLEISQDEAEILLDEIIIPDEKTNTPNIASLRTKLMGLIAKFSSEF